MDERAVGLQGRLAGVPVTVVTEGRVADADAAFVLERVETALRHVESPILHVRLAVVRAADPARPRPAMAHVAVDVDGEVLRAHVAAKDLRDAGDALEARVRDKVEQRAMHRKARRWLVPAVSPTGRRRGAPEDRIRITLPVDERRTIRRAIPLERMSPDEAAFDLDIDDERFVLFVDVATGADALLERDDDGSYRLTRARDADAEPGATAIPLTTSPVAAPVLRVDEAVERLDAADEACVFFVDAATGRGTVVYRRDDGHAGVLAPAG